MYYRKSSRVNGPWSEPAELGRFEGKSFFAGKIEKDQYGDHYLFGWTNILAGHTYAGAWSWGGNMVVHKIFQTSNGDLAVAIPHTLQTALNANKYALTINS